MQGVQEQQGQCQNLDAQVMHGQSQSRKQIHTIVDGQMQREGQHAQFQVLDEHVQNQQNGVQVLAVQNMNGLQNCASDRIGIVEASHVNAMHNEIGCIVSSIPTTKLAADSGILQLFLLAELIYVLQGVLIQDTNPVFRQLV